MLAAVESSELLDEFRLMRLQGLEYDDSGQPVGRCPGSGEVAPVVNGEALAVRAWRDGVMGPSLAIPYEVIAPPSRHWLGEPNPKWSGPGGVVFVTMDSEVGDPLPGGLRAQMEFIVDVVTWNVVNLVGWTASRLPVYLDYRTLRFDRAQYEAQIAGLPSAPIHDWSAELPINKEWWAAVTGE
jgi:hypothetical protein